MAMRVSPPRPRALSAALALGPALLARAVETRAPELAASLIDEAPAVVLGALQRRGRVIDRAAAKAEGATVLRRCTTGTAVYLQGRALLFTLALPALTTLSPDTTPRTLLNRNVRGFLLGFRQAGVMAHYFGREWISLNRRPAAVLGFEVLPGGAVLIELFAGLDAPLALPSSLATEDERAVDRWLGKSPAALADLITLGDPLALATRVGVALAERALLPIEEVEAPEDAPLLGEPIDDDDPAPRGALFSPPRRVPIGWLEAAHDPASGRVWLGGDFLVATHALRTIAETSARAPFEEGEIALDGASVIDLVEAARAAAR
ncbi:MAG: hypothetical protein ABI193_18235 [Minicystis sp.]